MEYPKTEQELKKSVDLLNSDWHSACPEAFVRYGFYPHYTHQRYRLLFVGREARGLAECDYIEALYNNNYIFGKMPKGNFHHRLLYLAYGLLNDFPDFAHIPGSREIAKNDFIAGRLSFSFMNISTISNESGVATQREKYDQSNRSGTNFRRDMIRLLAPDIIVCANCGSDISVLSDENGRKLLEMSDLVTTELLQFGGKRCLRFDTYHWGATKTREIGGLDSKNHFYDPVRDAFRKFRILLN